MQQEWRERCRSDDNIKIHLGETVCEGVDYSYSSGWKPVVGFCEYSDEDSGFIRAMPELYVYCIHSVNQNTFLVNYNPHVNTNVKSVHDNKKHDFINCFSVLSMLLISSYRSGISVDGLGSLPPQKFEFNYTSSLGAQCTPLGGPVHFQNTLYLT